MKALKVTYMDGTSEIVPSTLRAQAKAEERLHNLGLGTINDTPVNFVANMVYAAKRMSGADVGDFEAWSETVNDIEEVTQSDPKDKK